MSDLNFSLLKWQREVLSDNARFKVVVAGRRCGKTRLSIVKLIIKALECPVDDASILYVAPTMAMAKKLCWDLLLRLGEKVIVKANINNSEVIFVNGVKVYVLGADNPDSLRGLKLYYAVLDEFKDMRSTVWEMILRPALSDMRGGALFIGTPEAGESLFRDYYNLGESRLDPEWRSWHLTTADNELIDPREIEAAKRSMSTMAFLQEYMADFDTSISGIFRPEWFKSGPEPRDGSYFIAVDLAGFEDVSDPNKKRSLDDTAIAVVKIADDGRWWVKKVETFRKDVRETAVRILMNIRTYKPICVGIEKGALQRAVMPYLTDLMNKNAVWAHIELIATSGKSKKGSDAIANRVIYNLQGRFEHGRITFAEGEDHTKLKQQILMFPSSKAHDDACFPAGTLIITEEGEKPIERVTVNDRVLTRQGFSKVKRAWCSGYKKVITRLGITATSDHPIFTENRGWISLDSLCLNDILILAQPIRSTSCEKQFISTAEPITDTLTLLNQTIGNTTQVMPDGKQLPDCFTVMCGNSIMENPSPSDMKSIISTEISTTIIYPILYVSPLTNTEWSIGRKLLQDQVPLNIKNILQESEDLQRNGIVPQKDASGIDNTPCDLSPRTFPNNPASFAENSIPLKSTDQGCAAKNANGHDVTICNETHGDCVPVYDLSVEGGEFFAERVLVHNCDALSLVAYLHDTIYGQADDDVPEWEPLDEIAGV